MAGDLLGRLGVAAGHGRGVLAASLPAADQFGERHLALASITVRFSLLSLSGAANTNFSHRILQIPR